MRRLILPAIVCAALIPAGAAHAQFPYLSAYGFCTVPPESTYVGWTVYETDPYAYPDWIGYDVYRRTLPSCAAPVRVNDQSLPRQIGFTHTRYFGEVTPGSGGAFEYTVRPVDADHQPVALGAGFCAPCVVYIACPDPSAAPITIGTLTDMPHGLVVNPCVDACDPSVYFNGPIADQLRPYAGTSAVFKFFGTVTCGTVEGCAMEVTQAEPAACGGATPTAGRSWGTLKIRYR